MLQRLINDVSITRNCKAECCALRWHLSTALVVGAIVNRAIPRIDRDELSLVNSVPAGLLVVGRRDTGLSRSFKNLLDNAAKFTEPGGTIRFNCETTPTMVTISVQDNGYGIPPAQQDEGAVRALLPG